MGTLPMRYFSSCVTLTILALAACAAAFAQAPTYSNVGRAPTKEEIQAWNQSIGPEGKELPPGSGTAKEGEKIFGEKCAACHGPAGEGSQLAPRLVGGRGPLNTPTPSRTLANYWPFATTIWDYINRAMPPKQQSSLSASDVYALTAFILNRNEIIAETQVIDAASLPKVKMPNRDGFTPQNLGDIHDLRARGCSAGHCP
jgi:S-disulfanyl-L-cysteine oxidoreductase SoxD